METAAPYGLEVVCATATAGETPPKQNLLLKWEVAPPCMCMETGASSSGVAEISTLGTATCAACLLALLLSIAFALCEAMRFIQLLIRWIPSLAIEIKGAVDTASAFNWRTCISLEHEYAWVHTSIYIYICMWACMHVCMYVCMYVSLCTCTYVCTYVCMHVCVYVCMYVCIDVCIDVCIYVCMCVSGYVCLCVYVFVLKNPHYLPSRNICHSLRLGEYCSLSDQFFVWACCPSEQIIWPVGSLTNISASLWLLSSHTWSFTLMQIGRWHWNHNERKQDRMTGR